MKACTKHAVILVGTTRPRGESTSEMLGRELGTRLEQLDVTTSTAWITRLFQGGPRFQEFVQELGRADLLVLSTPIYMDALPYPVAALFEALSDGLEPRTRRLRCAAIANCGFPEAEHTAIGLGICRIFARKTGLEWLGGLGLGAGAALHAQALDDRPAMTHHVREAFDLAAAALTHGEPIPEAAVELMSHPIMAPPVYRWAGAAGWVMQGLQHGALTKLWARPFNR